MDRSLLGLWAVAALLAVVLAAVTHNVFASAAVALSFHLANLLYGWRQTQRIVRQAMSAPVELEWSGSTAPIDEVRAQALDAELAELGYQRVGALSRRDGAAGRQAVYLHPTLPIYAVLQHGTGGEPAAQLDSFFEDGGRLTTTAARDYGRFSAGAATGPRLVQLRVGGSPRALDGQHVGTLKPWITGKRRPLPLDPEALPRYLEADRRHMREALAADRLSFPDYVRALYGFPKGVLKF